MADEEVRDEEVRDAYSVRLALARAVNPMHVSMRIFGLLWKDKYTVLGSNRKFWSLDVSTIHCCIVVVLSWLNAIRFVISYDRNDTYGTTLFRKIFLHLINLQFAFGITTTVYYKHKHIKTLTLIWENYKLKHGGMTMNAIRRNFMIRVIAINLVILISTVAYTTVLALKSKQQYGIVKLIGEDRPKWLLLLGMIWITYLVLAWIQSFIFCVSMNKNIRGEFAELANEFNREMLEKDTCKRDPTKVDYFSYQREQPKQTSNRTEHYRQRYLELCRMVQKYDDVISCYLLSVYLFTIPAIILLVFALFRLDNDNVKEPTSYYIIFMSLVVYVVIVISVTVSAWSIKAAAQKPQQILHSINLCSCSTEEAMSIQVFLHKLASDHVGLTVWKFLNIDKRMLVTMFTIVITYLTMLLKFALALGSPEDMEGMEET